MTVRELIDALKNNHPATAQVEAHSHKLDIAFTVNSTELLKQHGCVYCVLTDAIKQRGRAR